MYLAVQTATLIVAFSPLAFGDSTMVRVNYDFRIANGNFEYRTASRGNVLMNKDFDVDVHSFVVRLHFHEVRSEGYELHVYVFEKSRPGINLKDLNDLESINPFPIELKGQFADQ